MGRPLGHALALCLASAMRCDVLYCTVRVLEHVTLDRTTLGVANWDSGTVDGIYDTSTIVLV